MSTLTTTQHMVQNHLLRVKLSAVITLLSHQDVLIHVTTNLAIFCLREFGRNGSDLRTQSCTYGREATGHYYNNDDLTFTIGEEFPGGAPNPVIFSRTNWPVSFINSILIILHAVLVSS